MQTHIRYLVSTERDRKWGMVVTSVGTQTIPPGAEYPNTDHPQRYLFTKEGGRILDEVQLVYITRGRGQFTSRTLGRTVSVEAGDMMVLFPGEWHSYWPLSRVGWEEYWIGFSGPLALQWIEASYISPQNPVLHISTDESLINRYKEAIGISVGQKASFHQLLSSIAASILFSAVFIARNSAYEADSSSTFIQRARNEILSDVASVTPVSLSRSLCIGYSKFRKLFKEYTGMTPGQFILNIRLMKAKERLVNTDDQIQEIAWSLGFENPDYFDTVFKRMTGMTPGAFRKGHALHPAKARATR